MKRGIRMTSEQIDRRRRLAINRPVYTSIESAHDPADRVVREKTKRKQAMWYRFHSAIAAALDLDEAPNEIRGLLDRADLKSKLGGGDILLLARIIEEITEYRTLPEAEDGCRA